MTIHASSARRYRRAPDVVSRRIRGEHVLVPIRRSSAALDSIFTLNGTAGFIWEAACDGLDPRALAQKLAATYCVDEVAAIADVNRVLDELLSAGALLPLTGTD